MEEEERRFKKEVESKGFFRRLSPYNRPLTLVVIAVFLGCVSGSLFPTKASVMGKILFALLNEDKDQMKKDANFWALIMFILALVAFVAFFGKIFGFGLVAENVTWIMRGKLYEAIVKKEIGWFDDRQNAPGVLTSILASDI